MVVPLSRGFPPDCDALTALVLIHTLARVLPNKSEDLMETTHASCSQPPNPH